MARDYNLTLEGGGLILDLYTWSNRGVGRSGYQALAGITGFGLPGTEVRWYEGAGDGAVYRGARQKKRTIEIPLYIKAGDRAELNRLVSQLATVLSPQVAPATLTYSLPGGEEWYLQVVRVDGGDWARMLDGSDNRTWVRLPLILESGNPYWTRAVPESFQVDPKVSDIGLLPELAKLQLSSGDAFGKRLVENNGDAEAWPKWYLQGPFETAKLISSSGKVLEWTGSIPVDTQLIIDTNQGTAIDSLGQNRYDGFTVAPQFWSIPPGNSEVTVLMSGTDEGEVVMGGVLAVNEAPYPSMEATEPLATPLRTNLIRNPSFTIGDALWGIDEGDAQWLATGGAGDGGAHMELGPDTSGNAAFFTTSVNVVAGKKYNLSYYMKILPTPYAAAIQTMVWQSGPATPVNNATLSQQTAGTWVRYNGSFIASETGTAYIGFQPQGYDSGDPNPTVYLDRVMLEQTEFLQPYFDGATAPTDPDTVHSFTGTPHQSPSIVSGLGVKGYAGTSSLAVVSSSQWRSHGTRSLKLTPRVNDAELTQGLSLSDNITFQEGIRYRARVVLRLIYPQISPKPLARQLFYGVDKNNIFAISPAAPNEAGAWPLEIEFIAQASSVGAKLQILPGVDPVPDLASELTNIWLDDLMVWSELEYYGEYFDGTNNPPGFYSEWVGTENESKSRLRVPERIHNTKLQCEWHPRRWAVV